MGSWFRKMIHRCLDQAVQTYRFILPRRPGWLAGMLLGWLLGRPNLDKAQTLALKKLPQDAVVVYLAKHCSRLERLFGQIRLKAQGLPGAGVGFGYPMLWFFPCLSALGLVVSKCVYFFRYFRKPDPFGSEALTRVLLRDGAFLHLVEPTVFHRSLGKPQPDPLEFLISMGRTTGRPVYLVPQLFFYGSGPAYARKSLLAALFGFQPHPGVFERVLKLLFMPGRIFVELADPVPLASLLADLDGSGQSDGQLALAVRQAMIERINRHRQSITGPVLRSVAELRQKALTGQRLQRFMKGYARRRNIAPHRVRKEAISHLDDMAALPNPYILRVGMALADRIVSRVFDGIQSGDQGPVNAIKNVAQTGPVVLIPCHKSHMDGLALSYMMYRNHLPCPYIFAGRNLSFWPMGWFLRRVGAFFVRRSFKGAVFYAMVFSEYIHLLLEQGPGTYIAAFIEGTRSRTGKLLPPQAGMLSILVNAVKNGACSDLNLVPVFIGYDQVPDAGAYLNEVRGEGKKSENLWQTLGALRFLRRRYGKIYINFTAPVSLRAALDEQSLDLDRLTSKQVNEFSRGLGARLLETVNQATRVTPQALTCAVLLNSPLNAVSRRRFQAMVQTYLNHLHACGAGLADSLRQDPDGAAFHMLMDLIRCRQVEVLSPPLANGRIPERFRVRPGRRPALAYYKNNCISFFAPAAFVASAILRADTFEFTAGSLENDINFLADLFANEFPRNSQEQGVRIRKTLKAFIDDGIVTSHPRPAADVSADRFGIPQPVRLHCLCDPFAGVICRGPGLS